MLFDRPATGEAMGRLPVFDGVDALARHQNGVADRGKFCVDDLTGNQAGVLILA